MARATRDIGRISDALNRGDVAGTLEALGLADLPALRRAAAAEVEKLIGLIDTIDGVDDERELDCEDEGAQCDDEGVML